MRIEIKHFRVTLLPHSLKFAEAAEANLWHETFGNSSQHSTVTGAAQVGQTLSSSTGTWTNGPTSFTYRFGNGVAVQAATKANIAAFESAGRNIDWTEVADQAAAAGSAALPVTIPRPTSPETEPPRFAELLVSSCTKSRYRKALLNDLDEDFQRDLSKGMTVGRARMRYRGSALRSITPRLWALAKRIGIFGLIADYAIKWARRRPAVCQSLLERLRQESPLPDVGYERTFK
jgi:hypothetical protein